jgi:hypothetical protein
MRVLTATLKIIWGIFAVIGILVIAAAAYLWFVDPFHLKPVLFPKAAPANVPVVSDNTPPRSPARSTSPAPQLNAQQAAAAASLGVDPNAVAGLLTPATEACAVAAIGQARVDQIKAGAAPSAVDLLQAGNCLSK